MTERPPFHPCGLCYRTVNEQAGAINPNCPNPACPEGLFMGRSHVPFLLSDTFLLRAIFVMTAFNFSIMLIFFLAGLFGGT